MNILMFLFQKIFSKPKRRIRIWKENRVIKTLTSQDVSKYFLLDAVERLGIDWDKITVHNSKTMKQIKKYKLKN